MAFFRSILPRGQVKDAQTMQRAGSGGLYLANGQPYVSNWPIDRIVREGYERSIWVFRGIDAIATNGARLPIKVRVGDEERGQYDETDPLLPLLNKRPNEFESAAQFRYRLLTLLILSKMGVFVEIVRTRGGDVAGFYLLPSRYTSPIPDKTKFVSAYRVELPGGERYDLPPENVLWIRKPHPTDPYLGVTPLEAAGISIDLDFYARLYNRTFMQNDGRPGGLVAVKGRLNPDDAAELKRRFAGGPQFAGRTSVVEADDVSWVDTATTPRDAQYVESLTKTKEDILLALGVPESVIGNASGRTYDNADAEYEVFWRTTMLPYLDLVGGAFDSITAGGINDDRYVVHDTSSVFVLQRDFQNAKDKKLAEVGAGLATIDEYRDFCGEDTFDVPGTRTLWPAGGKFPIAQNDEDQKVVEGLTTLGAATPPMPEDPNADPNADAPPGGDTEGVDYPGASGTPDWQASRQQLQAAGHPAGWRVMSKAAAAQLQVGDVIDVDEPLEFLAGDPPPLERDDAEVPATVSGVEMDGSRVHVVDAGARLEVVGVEDEAVHFRVVA